MVPSLICTWGPAGEPAKASPPGPIPECSDQLGTGRAQALSSAARVENHGCGPSLLQGPRTDSIGIVWLPKLVGNADSQAHSRPSGQSQAPDKIPGDSGCPPLSPEQRRSIPKALSQFHSGLEAGE